MAMRDNQCLDCDRARKTGVAAPPALGARRSSGDLRLDIYCSTQYTLLGRQHFEKSYNYSSNPAFKLPRVRSNETYRNTARIRLA